MSLVKTSQPLLIQRGSGKYLKSSVWNKERAKVDKTYPQNPDAPIGYYLLVEKRNQGRESIVSDGNRTFIIHPDHGEIVLGVLFQLKSEDFSGGSHTLARYSCKVVRGEPLPFVYCFGKPHENWRGRSGRLPVTFNGEIMSIYCEETPNDRDNPTSWTYTFSM